LPGFDGWRRRDTSLLINLQPGDFIFFSYYAVAGVVPPVSSFLFTLLEFYGLQLQHLSLHSLILVVIFIHFCEMFVCVQPSITLFQIFHVLRWSGKGSGLIDTYYFQLRAKGPIAFISFGKWYHWRKDWVIIQADVHKCLALPTESVMAKKSAWEEAPKLHVAYGPMI
jgi:hypothetical protein